MQLSRVAVCRDVAKPLKACKPRILSQLVKVYMQLRSGTSLSHWRGVLKLRGMRLLAPRLGCNLGRVLEQYSWTAGRQR